MDNEKVKDTNVKIPVIIGNETFQVAVGTASKTLQIIKNDIEVQSKKAEMGEHDLSLLNNNCDILKVFNNMNIFEGNAKKHKEVDLYEYTTDGKDSFSLTGTDKDTATSLIGNYGNEMQKDMLYFLLKCTEAGSAKIEINNDDYFKMMGITKHTLNKQAFRDRLRSYQQTDYTVYFVDAKGKREYIKTPLVSYVQKGVWANKKDGTRELFWQTTIIDIKWLDEIVKARQSKSEISLIDNDIFLRIGGKKASSNFVALYVNLEHLYRNNVKNLNAEKYSKLSVSRLLKYLVFNEKTVKSKGYNVVIKNPIEKFLSEFFEWKYENVNMKKRKDFENNSIWYRPKKYLVKIENYPK